MHCELTCCFNIHLGKTKVMFNSHAETSPVIVAGTTIEGLDSYVTLGKKIARNRALLLDVKIRVVLDWAAIGKVYAIMRSPKSTSETKRKLFNEYVPPVIIYGSSTQPLDGELQWLNVKWNKS